jgi:hypothetical protein
MILISSLSVCISFHWCRYDASTQLKAAQRSRKERTIEMLARPEQRRRKETAANTEAINPAALPVRQLMARALLKRTAIDHMILPPKTITKQKATANIAEAITSQSLTASERRVFTSEPVHDPMLDVSGLVALNFFKRSRIPIEIALIWEYEDR